MLPTFGVLFLLLALSGCQSESEEAPPPNVILIVADDLGYGDLGTYGQTRIRTPALDRMAEMGLRFTQFYAGSTVCAPSRSVLLTGLHTGHTPIRGNKETMPIGQEPLPDSAVTIAEVLRDKGYATGAFGKWGLGGPDSKGLPSRQGFDEFFGYLGQRRAHFYYPEFLFRDRRGAALERVPLEGNEVDDTASDDFQHPSSGPPLQRGRYSHDAIAEEALGFIDRHRDAPFFLYLPFTIPHAALTVPDASLAAYRDEQGNSIFSETPFPGGHYTAQPTPNAAYAAMITHLDRTVGQVMDALEARGLAKRTIVLFTSDNGPHNAGGYDPSYFDSNGLLRGIKRDLYEGGIRVPMIAWGPGTVPSDRVSDHVWAAWDLLPTFAELAGAESPAGLDGRSMAPLLRGESADEHESLYWEFYGTAPKQAVRMGKWKGIRRPTGTPSFELFDLDADPGEQTNVADQHPEVVSRLQARMREAHTPSPLWPSPFQSALSQAERMLGPER